MYSPLLIATICTAILLIATICTIRNARSSPVEEETLNGKVPPNEEVDQDEDGDHFYYFAYGSNLLTERMHVSNPSAVYVGNGAVPGYRLVFGGWYSKLWGGSPATILQDQGSVVIGVVWKLSSDHSKSLDRQEGRYRRLYVDVNILPDGDDHATISNDYIASPPYIRCRTYEMIRNDSIPFMEDKPSPYYKRVVLEGSTEHKLPIEYHKRLEAIEDNGYKGPIPMKLKLFEKEQK